MYQLIAIFSGPSRVNPVAAAVMLNKKKNCLSLKSLVYLRRSFFCIMSSLYYFSFYWYSFLFFMLNALANLFGIGGGSLISRLLGVDKKGVRKIGLLVQYYGTILVTALYCILCQVFMTPIRSWIGASENTLGFASDYTLWVVVIGGVPATLSMLMSYLLRSEGHGNKASFGLSMGGILNILLDPVFMFVIFPEGQEATGVAVATMLSNVAALLHQCRVDGKWLEYHQAVVTS